MNGAVKALFRRTRPIAEFERPHRLRQPRTSSFPSGHASAAFVAAALLSDGRRAKPLYYGVAGVVALSRVHVRIHHASDVVGGIAVGVALGAIVKRVGRWAKRRWAFARCWPASVERVVLERHQKHADIEQEVRDLVARDEVATLSVGQTAIDQRAPR